MWIGSEVQKRFCWTKICSFKKPLKLLPPKKSSKFDSEEKPLKLLNDWNDPPPLRATMMLKKCQAVNEGAPTVDYSPSSDSRAAGAADATAKREATAIMAFFANMLISSKVNECWSRLGLNEQAYDEIR